MEKEHIGRDWLDMDQSKEEKKETAEASNEDYVMDAANIDQAALNI